MGQRDIRLSAVESASLLRSKSMQREAYDGVVKQMDELMTQMNISPDGVAETIDGAYGTTDALVASTLLEGSDKMQIIDGIRGSKFSATWADASEVNRKKAFNNAVLDVLMSSTRNLSGEKQSYAINTIRKLKSANETTGLTGEPMIANQLATMYSMFSDGVGPKLDKKAQERRQALQNGIYQKDIGSREYEFAFQDTDEGLIELAQWDSFDGSQIDTAERMGMFDSKGRYTIQEGDAALVRRVSENRITDFVNHEIYVGMHNSGKGEKLDGLRKIINTLSEDDSPRRDHGDTIGVTGTIRSMTLDEVFGTGTGTFTGRVGDAIRSNPRMAEAWDNADPKMRMAIVLTGLERAYAAPTAVARKISDNFVANAQLKPSIPLQKQAGEIDSRYFNVVAKITEDGDLEKAREELLSLKKRQNTHKTHLHQVNMQVKDQETQFGFASEDMLSIQKDMQEIGASLLKYESDLSALALSPSERDSDVSSMASEMARSAVDKEWFRKDNIELRVNVVQGAMNTRTGTISSERVYFVVPKDAPEDFPLSDGIKIGAIPPFSANRYLRELNRSLFELNEEE
jgi:hypothetical protein